MRQEGEGYLLLARDCPYKRFTGVEDDACLHDQHLLSLLKSDDIQGSSVLRHTESGVLPLLAEAAHGRGQLDGVGTKQRRRIPRSVRLTALQFSDQRRCDVR